MKMDDEGETIREIPGLGEPDIKGKKGKKKANAKKTLTLQNFLHDGSSQENGGGGGGSVPQTENHINKHALDEKEQAILESCHSYIHDYLKQRGPTQAMDAALQAEIQNFPPEAKQVMTKVGGYKAFILLCKDLVVVDKIVAASAHITQAKDMAFKEICNNISGNKQAPIPTSEHKQIWNSNNNPNSKAPSTWSSSSLFSENSSGGTLQYHSTEPNQAENTDTSVGKGIIGSNLMKNGIFSTDLKFGPDSGEEMQKKIRNLTTSNNQLIIQLNEKEKQLAEASTLESKLHQGLKFGLEGEELQKKIWNLMTSNNQLIIQLNEKEKQLAETSTLETKLHQLERDNELARKSIKEYREEVERLKQELQEVRGDQSDSLNTRSDSDRDLILSLQKQLETERLKNRNLAHQQGVENQMSGMNLQPETSSVLLQSLNPGINRNSSFGSLNIGLDNDPFGLRSMSMSSGGLPMLGTPDMKLGQSMYGAIGSDLSKMRGMPINKPASASTIGVFPSGLGMPIPGYSSSMVLPSTTIGPGQFSSMLPSSNLIYSQLNALSQLGSASALTQLQGGAALSHLQGAATLSQLQGGSALSILQGSASLSQLQGGVTLSQPQGGAMFGQQLIAGSGGYGTGSLSGHGGMGQMAPHLLSGMQGGGGDSNPGSACSTPAPTGGKANSAIRQDQLVKRLVSSIPGSSEDVVKHYIQVLRDKHGKLSGWPTSRIAQEIVTLMSQQG